MKKTLSLLLIISMLAVMFNGVGIVYADEPVTRIVAPAANDEITASSVTLSAYVKDSTVEDEVKFFINEAELTPNLNETSGNWEASYTITSNGKKTFEVLYPENGTKHLMSVTFNANVTPKANEFVKTWDGTETTAISSNTFTEAEATGKDGTNARAYTVTGTNTGWLQPDALGIRSGRVCYEADLNLTDNNKYYGYMEIGVNTKGLNSTSDGYTTLYGAGTGRDDNYLFYNGKINGKNTYSGGWIHLKYVVDLNTKMTEIWIDGVKISESALIDSDKNPIADTTGYVVCSKMRFNYRGRSSATATDTATATVDNVRIYEELPLTKITAVTYGSSATAVVNDIIPYGENTVSITFDSAVTGDVKLNGIVISDTNEDEKIVTVSLADVQDKKFRIEAGSSEIMLYRPDAGVEIINPSENDTVNDKELTLKAFVKDADTVEFLIDDNVVKTFTGADVEAYKNYEDTYDLSLNQAISGKGNKAFTVRYTKGVAAPVTSAVRTFNYQFDVAKYNWIAKVEGVSTTPLAGDDVTSMMTTLELDGETLYSSADKDLIASLINAETAKTTAITTVDELIAYIKDILIINAFNTSKSATSVDGKIAYADKIGIKDTALHNDYLASLSSDGISAVNSDILGGNYKKFDDIKAKFNELVLLNAIVNNVAFGGGHVSGLLTTYATEYRAEGFELDKYKDVKATNEEIAKCGAETLSELKEIFNGYFDGTSGGGSTSTGNNNSRPSYVPSYSGGSSGGGGGGGSSFYVPAPSQPSIPNTPSAGTSKFSDISTASWAETAIDYLYEKGIISGRGDGTFGCNDTVTRAEYVKMIVEALGIPEAEGDAPYGDVSETDWFAEYINRATLSGLITGSNGLFNPNGAITRQDAAVIIFRALPTLEKSDAQFGDADEIADYALEAAGALANAGLMNGVGNNTFSPLTSLTRAQAAQLIYNILTGGVIQ